MCPNRSSLDVLLVPEVLDDETEGIGSVSLAGEQQLAECLHTKGLGFERSLALAALAACQSDGMRV